MKSKDRYVDPVKESLREAKHRVSKANANAVAYEQYLHMTNVLRSESLPAVGKVTIELRGVPVTFTADEAEVKAVANTFSTGGKF